MKLGNTATRIIVSVIAIPVIIGACLAGRYYFLIFALLIGLTAFYEFAGMSKKKDAHPELITGMSAVAAFIINTYFRFTDSYNLALIAGVVIVLVELFRNNGSAIHNIGSSFIGIFYIGLFISSAVGVREFYAGYDALYQRGGYLIIAMLATIWICDSAAFFGGTALGKHKLFPRVSPNKSWEGAIFGFVFAVAAMVGAKYIILDFLSLNDSIMLGVIIGIIGQLGDLVESLLKRDAGVKDSSNIIPGHGGIYDRFDSLMVSAPVVFLYLKLFIKN